MSIRKSINLRNRSSSSSWSRLGHWASATPILHRTLHWTSCFISDQVWFGCLHSFSIVHLNVSQGSVLTSPNTIQKIPLHSLSVHWRLIFSQRLPNPAPFVPINNHINIHIRYSVGPINVKNAYKTSVHKDLKFDVDWFGDFPSALTIQQNWMNYFSK